MATSTTNLGLTKPSVNDAADIGVLNSNFDKIDTAVAGKTNSWYGLGEIGVYCSDCNNAQRNGWFCIDTNTANLPESGVSGTLFVETRPSSYGVDVYQTIKSGVTVIQRYYSSWAGTWQPWEWVNPPMSLGVEYRTTERWQGKAVYTMQMDCGVGVNNKIVTCPSCTRMLRHHGTLNVFSLPMGNYTGYHAYSSMNVSRLAVQLHTDEREDGIGSWGASWAETLWYTKD